MASSFRWYFPERLLFFFCLRSRGHPPNSDRRNCLRQRSQSLSVRVCGSYFSHPADSAPHLIDSASNNHQRFVRATLQTSLDVPGYDQTGSVRVQAVQYADWQLLVSLWATYNRYLAHVIGQLPATKLETVCRIGSGDAVTLGFLATDYVTHLVHHLNQLGAADLNLGALLPLTERRP
jgi:hypothetical protein